MSPARPTLLSILLVSLALRIVIGAPCCLDSTQLEAPADQPGHALAHCGAKPDKAFVAMWNERTAQNADHGGAGDGQTGSHSGHDDDGPRANPCCSACEPALPGDTVSFATVRDVQADYTAQGLRDIAAREPLRAYEARGPPYRI